MKISFTKKKNKQNKTKRQKKEKEKKLPTARVEPWTINVIRECVIYCATTVSSTVNMIILNTFADKVLLLRPCLHVVGYPGLVG